LPGITRSEVGRHGVAGGDGRKRLGSASAVGKTQLTSRARLTERQGRGGRLGEMRTEKENIFPTKMRPTRGLDGLARMISAYGDSAAGGLPGPEAKRAAGSAEPKIRKKKKFPNENWIFEFTKALEICRRRFRRNFDMRIFPKFF
jgi:hypothetical protein